MASSSTLCQICSRPATSHCARCKQAQYCSADCQRQDWSTHRNSCGLTLYYVASSNFGMGMFAQVNLSAGQVIITETSLLRVPSPVTSAHLQSLNLSPELQSQMLELYSGPAPEPDHWTRLSQVVFYNAFSNGGLNDVGHDTQSLYWDISRCNHACVPNAAVAPAGIEEPTGKTKVKLVALYDILEGEEILIDYSGAILNDYSGRRQALRQQFDFECQCWACRRGPESEPNISYNRYALLRFGLLRGLLPVRPEEMEKIFLTLNHYLRSIYPRGIIYEYNQIMDDVRQLQMRLEYQDKVSGRAVAERILKQGRWLGEPRMLEFAKHYLSM